MRGVAAILTALVFLFQPAISGGFPRTHPDRLVYKPLLFQPPPVARHTLANGLVLRLSADHDTPLVEVSAMFRTGAMHDPAGREGLAAITGQVMRTGGTSETPAHVVDETLEFLAAILSVQVGLEETTFRLSVLKRDLETGLRILAGILREPAFADGRLQLAKSLSQEDLRRLADDPQRLAFHMFRRVLYAGDPRGRLPGVASVGAIQREDCLAFHRRHFRPDGAMFAVTGDITPEEAVSVMEKHFLSWPRRGAAEGPPPPPKRSPGVYFLAKDTPQAIVLIGQAAPSRADGDAVPFEVLDFLAGSGGFRSRIFQEIRTNRGLAYATGSVYHGRARYGVFQAYALTQATEAGRVLGLLRDIFGNLRDAPVSPGELSWAKRSMENSFLFSFGTTHGAAMQYLRTDLDGLPEDTLTAYRGRIRAVDAEAVRSAAREHLKPEDAVILVTGPEILYEGLRAVDPGLQKVPFSPN